jgi:hypothetical protein
MPPNAAKAVGLGRAMPCQASKRMSLLDRSSEPSGNSSADAVAAPAACIISVIGPDIPAVGADAFRDDNVAGVEVRFRDLNSKLVLDEFFE